MLKTERAQFLVDNLDLPQAAQFEGARWEYFQLSHLQDDSIFRNETKSRQIAWSWLCAAEAVADGILDAKGSTFVSINLDEAKEKIRYSKNVIEALPLGMRPKLRTDNQTELEFANGARLISLPSKPPRGKSQMNLYLDEFAHIPNDRDIYTGGLPMISKGGCRMRMGSSPMGASGMHWEIAKEELRAYPGYTRKITPWWEVFAFCNDVKAAYKLAPYMTTEARVLQYGNDRIKIIFENMPLEDFQQEYEAMFVDETTAWISWDIIKRNQQADLLYYHLTGHEDDVAGIIQKIKVAIKQRWIEPSFAAGVDVGRTKNLTELVMVGKSTTGQLPLRLMISLASTEYEYQEHVLYQIFDQLPISRALIDRNGIGNQLAETFEKSFRGKVEGVNFTNASKELWAVEARVKAEKGLTPIPAYRDLAYQIHSIKKKVTAAKNNVFDTDANEKHHADKFWAWALAIWASDGSRGRKKAKARSRV